MKKRKKLMIIVPVVLLLVVAVGYKMVLAPKPKPVKMKIAGTLVPLQSDFVVNLADGHYGKVTVALLLTKAPSAQPGQPIVLPEDAAIRAIITDELTGASSDELVDRAARHALLDRLLKTLKAQTDEPITKVLFTDIAVQ